MTPPEHPQRNDSHVEPNSCTSSHPKEGEHLIRQGFLALAGRFIGRGQRILTQVLIGRALGAELFGSFALAWTLLRIGRVIGLAGQDKAIQRFGADVQRSRHSRYLTPLVRMTLAITVGTSFALAAWMFLSAPFLSTRVFADPNLVVILRLFSLTVPIVTTFSLATAISRLTLSNRLTVLSEEFIQPSVQLVGCGLALVLGAKLVGIGIATSGSFLFGGAIAWFGVHRLVLGQTNDGPSPMGLTNGNSSSELQAGSPSRVTPTSLLNFGTQASLATSINLALLWSDRLMIGAILGPVAVGVYQASSQLTTGLIAITGAFGAIFMPMIARSSSLQDQPAQKSLYATHAVWTTQLGGLAGAFLLVVPETVLQLSFGNEYLEASLPLSILACGQLLSILTGPTNLLLIMSGRQLDWLILTILALGINVVANLILIPVLGITGAALVSAITIGGLHLAALFRVRTVLGSWPHLHLLPGVLLPLLGGGLVASLAVRTHSTSSDVVRLCVFGAAMALTFIVLRTLTVLCTKEDTTEWKALTAFVASKLSQSSPEDD